MIDKRAIFNEIRAFIESAEEKRQPGDFTYKEFEEEFGIQHDKAQAILGKLIKAGKMQRIEVNGPGFKCVFRWVA